MASRMNIILEKFMFQKDKSGDNGGGAAKSFHELLGLSSSPGKDADAKKAARSFETPRPNRDVSDLMKQIQEAGEAMRVLQKLAAKGESSTESFEKKIAALCTGIEGILAQKDEKHARAIWKFSIDAWNLAVSCKQSNPSLKVESVNQLSCKIALEVLPLLCGESAAGDAPEIHSSLWRRLLETGAMWMKKDEDEKAEFCFSRASETTKRMSGFVSDHNLPAHKREDILVLLFGLHTKRGQAALRSGQNILVTSLVARCKEMSKTLPSDLSSATLCALAEELFSFGEALVSSDQDCESVAMFDSAIEVLGDLRRHSSAASQSGVSKKLKNVLVRITKNLAHAHLKAKNFSAAQSVLTFLKPKLEPDLDKHNSFHLMSIQAALGLEKMDEAIRILEATTRAPEGSSLLVHLEKFKLCYRSCGRKDLEKVTALFVHFCDATKNAALALDLCCFLLKQDASDASEHSNRYAGAAVAIAGDPKVTKIFNTEDKTNCERLFGILFDTAVGFYQAFNTASGIYDTDLDCVIEPPTWYLGTAKDLFQTCLVYASLSESSASDALLRTKVLRSLSMVLLKQKERKKAVQHLALAKDLEPDNIWNDLILIRVHIEEKAYPECLALIKTLTRSPSFHPKYLINTCKEAIGDEQNHVASECLHQVFEHQKKTKEIIKPHATLLISMITLSQEEKDKHEATAKYLEDACALFEEDREAFLKSPVAAVDGEAAANWFATTAWNLGLKLGTDDCQSGGGGNPGLASRMFEVSARFFQSLGDASAPQACLALLHAASLLLESEEALTGPARARTETDRRQEMTRLSDLVRDLNLVFLRAKSAGLLEEEPRAKIGAALPWLQYEVACRNRDVAGALHLLGEVRLISTDPALFLRMARSAGLLEANSAAVKVVALNLAMKHFQAAVPANYAGVAFCFRHLVDLRSTDAEGIALAAQAVEVLKTTAAALEGDGGGSEEGGDDVGGFPPEEVQWLATTAWNRGVQLHDFGDQALGSQWMRVGLNLLGHCGAALEAETERARAHFEAACENNKGNDENAAAAAADAMEIEVV